MQPRTDMLTVRHLLTCMNDIILWIRTVELIDSCATDVCQVYEQYCNASGTNSRTTVHFVSATTRTVANLLDSGYRNITIQNDVYPLCKYVALANKNRKLYCES
jgi:hypothetical protein